MAVGWRANNIYYDYDVDDDDTTSDGISSSSASETSGKWMEVTRSHHLEHYHQPSRYSPHYHHHHHRLLKQAHQADRPADLIKMVLVSAALEKSSKSQELGGDSAMDKMKKILGSPMTKKRSMVASTPSAGQAGKYFGVALEEITTREGSHIPHLVTRVCTYIKEYGITQEGIFRVNGNSRIVDRLKASFDRAGDADLEEAGDVMAVAGMLKLYLRELPEPVIPDYLTSKFIAIQNESGHNVKEVIERLRHLLGKLPTVNYQLLKYLCRFLVLVSLAQNLNKMSPMALGIVFGPNVFSDRCSGGMEGLRQQGTTNQITLHFILKYDQLFVEDGEISPYINHSLSDGKKGKMSPPRPPPPSLDSPTSQHPVPLPRKSRRKAAENPNGHFTSDSDPSGETTPRTPRLSDEEYLDTNRSVSPFVLDSDRSEAGSISVASPLLPSISNETVEKTISTSISQHLFGEPSDSLSSDEQPAHQSSEVTPVPAPRQKRDQLDSLEDLNEDDLGKENRPLAAHKTSVKDRIHLFEADDIATSSREHPKPRKQRPRSKAFEIFESQGIIIGMAPGNLHVESHGDAVESPEVEKHFPSNSGNVSPSSPSHPIPPPRGAKRNVNGEETREGERMETSITRDDSELSKVPTSNPLTSFKRPAGPKNRRTPSRHSLRQMVPGDEDGEDEGDGAEEAEEVAEEAREKDVIVSPEQGEEEEEDGIELVEDVNHNATTKPSIRFLDIHHHNHNGNNEPASPDRQHPMIGHVHKPYIPPLDLSILHEHGDGSDPILAEQGLSLAILHKAKSGTRDDEVILSPRTSKLKKKANNMGLSHEDEFANTIKQLTRRIQTYKKKIKTFEENFEDDYGYRPSQSDKANKPEIKKTMQQLAFARKELKRVKERLREYNDQMSDGGELSPRYGSPAHHAALDEDFFQPPTIEDTLDLLMRKLREKQDECQRPAYLEDMSRDQIQDEKLAVQKTLLQYENIHGRPSSESAKKLMKPLYDRYRTIKRILAKPTSPREKKLDLPPVPEDDAVEFSHDAESKSPQHAINIPTSVSPHETDFTVTQNLGLLTTKDTLKPHDDNAQLDTSPEGPQQWKANLHELTVPQLLEEQTRARNDKKRLRRVLREFEEDFFQHTGRKVQKEDRAPMEAEYHEYKQVKARLKLLDALLVKYDPTL